MFSVRNARPSDVAHIAPWTGRTFSWGDYVAESLPQWLDNPDLQVLVAAGEDDLPVAVSVVQMLSPREGWLSAARVHPESRRRGLGTLLNDASVEWIREQGGEVARLAVEDSNEAAIFQVIKLGYRPGSVWAFAQSEDGPTLLLDDADKLSVSGRGDVDPAWMYWSTSEIADAGRMLVPSGWKWRRAVVEDIDIAARERRLLSNAAGWLIIETGTEPDWVEVVWVAAGQNDFPRLVQAVLHYARGRRIDDVSFKIPETNWTSEALRREGFSVSAVTVYSKSVVAGDRPVTSRSG